MGNEKTALQNDPDFKIFMEERLQSYTFLAAAYQKEIPLVFLENLQDSQPGLDGQLGLFIASLADADLEQVRVDLAADYAKLFLGMSTSPVPPFESVYTSERELLMQEAYRSVKQQYREKGYTKQEEFNLPEDHIALELEFLTLLIKDCLKSLESNDEDAKDDALKLHNMFLKEHLLNWVFDFCSKVDKRANTMFYRGVSELTQNCLSVDAKYFGLEG